MVRIGTWNLAGKWTDTGDDGYTHTNRQRELLADQECDLWLLTEVRLWGGDWNQPLRGPDWVGSVGGRRCLLGATKGLGLQVPTTGLRHREEGMASIDHIAVSAAWRVARRKRIACEKRVSDHPIYCINVDPR